MNVDGGKIGDGILNIKAENEGLDTELHLTINGGIINITAGNDGINTNEDNVSVTTINGVTLNILCDGATGKGDGIDSNGWLVINGGTVNAQACSTSGDAGIDSDKGIYINGGTVVATGNMLDHFAGGEQTYAVFTFASRQNGGTYILKNAENKAVGEYTLENAFNFLIVAGDYLAEGDYTFWNGETQLSAIKSDKMQGGMPQGERPQMPNGDMPEDFTPPEMPDVEIKQFPGNMNGERPDAQNERPPQMPDGSAPPEGFTPPEMPDDAGNMVPPNGFGGMQGGFTANSETSSVFTILKGSNQFVNVSPAN